MSNDDRTDEPPGRDLLRAMVDGISAKLAYWDRTLRCRFANRAYERWFGVEPGAMLGKHIEELVGPRYRINLPQIEAVLRGEPQEFERELPDPSGTELRHGLTQYVPDVVGGEVRGFFVCVTDLSAFKRAGQALRDSEERLRMIIDEAPIGMAIVDAGGRFVRVNRALCEIVGYTAEELAALTFQAITHPEDLDADLALVGRLARGEISRYTLAKRYIRKDGPVVDVMLSASVVRDSGGAPRYYIGQIQDITAQKRLERELRFLADVGPVLATTLDYEETMRRIAGLAVRDFADFCIVDIVEDNGWVRRVEVACNDPTKQWICDILKDISIEPGRGYLLRPVVQTRRPVLLQRPSTEMVAAYADNEELARALAAADVRSLVAVPLLVRDRLLGALAFVSTSSARTYGAVDIRFAEALAQRAALSIENARLFREAQRATTLRDEVLEVVAHDLRNPLGAIMLQTGRLRRHEGDADRRRSLEAIERAARRMNRLIHDLLDVTRVEAGRLALAPASLPARQVVSDAVEAERALAAAAAIELRLELAADLPEIWADRDRLLQVFDNLIGNAIKFTRAGGRITVAAEARADAVLFRVRDTGRGMAPEQLPHVFDRFWQAEKGDARGAGLGLSIVKGIVDAHHGRIWADSAPDVGSTFSFTIPTTAHAERLRAEAEGT